MRDAYKPTFADDIACNMASVYNRRSLSDDIWNKCLNQAVLYNINEINGILEKETLVEQNRLPNPVMWLEWEEDLRDSEFGILRLGVMVVENGGREHTNSDINGFIFVGTNGKIAYAGMYGGNYGDTLISVRSSIEYGMESSRKMQVIVANAAGNATYAIKLLNCKNITTITKEGPATINERRKREGKPPYTSYKVLKLPIGDQQRVVTGNQNNDKNECLTRLHVCRGHFKTYTEDKPLMGRHTGTYWWPQMLKGKKENGQVIKDYKLEMTTS